MIVIITNRRLIKDGDLFQKIEGACRGGASHIMLREKDLDDGALLELAIKVKVITDRYGKKLIINNNIPVANQLKAYGVQLSVSGLKDIERCAVKVGISVHTYNEASLSIKCGADYLLASHMFETDCKQGLKPNGVKLIEEIRLASSIPIVALGGITEENCQEPIKAGAQGIAVMTSVMTDLDPEQLIRRINLKL